MMESNELNEKARELLITLTPFPSNETQVAEFAAVFAAKHTQELQTKLDRYEAMMANVSGIDLSQGFRYTRLWRANDGSDLGKWWTWLDGGDKKFDTALDAYESIEKHGRAEEE